MKSTWSPQTEDYKNAIVLYDDNWNDFGYRTTFHMTFCDDNGEVKRIGDIKIYYWDFDEKRNSNYMIAVSSVVPDYIVARKILFVRAEFTVLPEFKKVSS